MKNLLFAFICLLAPCAASAQTNGKPTKQPAVPRYLLNELDPLGRRYAAVIGLLPTSSTPTVHPEIARLIGLTYENVVSGNANTPYGSVHKDKIGVAKDIAKYLSKKDLRKYYFWESVGCEYLLQVDVSNQTMAVSYDSFRNERPREKKIYHFAANATATVIDVATAKVVSLQNFTVQSNSRLVAPAPSPRTDSTQALLKLYEEVRKQVDSRTFRNLLCGVGTVEQTVEKKPGKADEVIVNANRVMAFSTYQSEFDVYAMREQFELRGQIFWHMERLGTVAKGRGYDYQRHNFEVQSGGKAIAEAHIARVPLICTPFQQLPPLSPLPPGGWRRSLAIDTFQSVTNVLEPYRLRMFQDALAEKLVQWPQLLDVVDRASYRLVEAERSMQSATKSDATQGSIDIGAEYLLAGEVVNYRETRSKHPYTGPLQRAYDETIRADAQINLRLVSVKTGEILWVEPFKVSAWRSFPFVGNGAMDEIRSMAMSKIVADTFAQLHGRAIFERLNGDAPLLKILQTDGPEAKQVLLGGGQWAGFRLSDQFEVVEESEELVDGQRLLRETVVATLLVTEVFPQTTACKVKKGQPELLAKFNAGANLRCRRQK